MPSITVVLSEKEEQALKELSEKQELSPQQVMRMGLRLYQFVVIGGAKVTPPENDLKKSLPFGGDKERGTASDV